MYNFREIALHWPQNEATEIDEDKFGFLSCSEVRNEADKYCCFVFCICLKKKSK